VLQIQDTVYGATEGFEVRGWDTGAVIARTAFTSAGGLISIYRGDLQQALISRVEKLDNVEIRLGSRIVDVDTDSSEVVVATGERLSGDLIIVADGVNSKLKWKVCPSESETAQPTGDAAYRLILPRALLEKDEELLALVQSSWVKRWDGPGGHVVAYAVHNHELLNVALIHPEDHHAEESWTSMIEKHHVVAAFQGWNRVLQNLIQLAPAEVPNFRILTHSPSPTWVKGSVILLGDACHAMP
jgi:salicylate hydroxylase